MPPTTNGTALVLKAAQFAAQKHRDQHRKDVRSTPYINHPRELAHVLSSEGGVTDPVVLAAALLHDTIEDTETSYEELRGTFGTLVADTVIGAPKGWSLRRQQEYFDWAKAVVDEVRDANPRLARKFDALYRQKP
jgi:guanosine-3',5'-bis(diphosphate) 3'-pyrophosphohydrolase